jgi:hypothetical protein
MNSKRKQNKVKQHSKKRSNKRHIRKLRGGELQDYTTPMSPIMFNTDEMSKLPELPPRPTKPFTLPEKAKESCKLCNKLSISNDYDLCKSCDKFVFSEADKLRSDRMINELSTVDALKGVFELTVVEILKKGSYHGLPGFTLLRNKTNNDPTLSTIKKAYLNALINISLNQFYKLADSVLNYSQYTQLNGPKADIKTPGDITRVLEQVSGLLNEMNKTYNTQLGTTDEQIINYMKGTIISDLKKNPTVTPGIVDNFNYADVSQLQLFLKGNPELVNNLSYDSTEFIKVLGQIGSITPQSQPIQESKKNSFFSRFFKG